MLEVTIRNAVTGDETSFPGCEDVIVYPDGDDNAGVFVSIKYGRQNYYNIYDQPAMVYVREI